MTLCTSIHTHTHTIYENLYKHKQCNNNHSWVTFKWKTFKNLHNRLDLFFPVPFKPSKMRVLTYVRQSLLNFFSQLRHIWQIRIAKKREILKIESEVFIYEQKKVNPLRIFTHLCFYRIYVWYCINLCVCMCVMLNKKNYINNPKLCVVSFALL